MTAGWPSLRSRLTWSAISAIRGLTTIVSDGEASPGNW